MSPEDVLGLCRERNVEAVDLRFTDVQGTLLHQTVPVRALTRSSFESGLRFDAALLNCRDGRPPTLRLVPDAATATIDPFCQHTTLAMLCDAVDAAGRPPAAGDPRSVARRCADFVRSSGVADAAHFGVALEFYIFDQASFEQGSHQAHYRVDSREGPWRRGRDEPDNLGSQIPPNRGGMAAAPADSLQSLRGEIVALLEYCGVEVAAHCHAVGTAGHARIELRPAALLEACDHVVQAKYTARNAAARHGKVVTFMPRPLFEVSGSRMRLQVDLAKAGHSVLRDRGGACGLSDAGRHAVGGLLRHATGLQAFTNPTTNAYRRPPTDAEGPLFLTYSARTAETALRVPDGVDEEDWSVEVRFPDPSGNPYLAFSALTMAAIHGIAEEIEPGAPLETELHELADVERQQLRRGPASLDAALAALEADHAFLTQSGVFPEELIHAWIRRKREVEIAALQARPHPYEFCLYFNV